MSGEKDVWLKISGVSGVFTPIIAFTFILLAIAYSPEFSWTENALSDLGVQEGITANLFNYGIIISGIFAMIFALGLFTFLREKLLGKIGAFIFILDILALIAIGVFPENVKPTHYYVSVIFFALFPISMLIICATFLRSGKVKMGIFTFLMAFVAAAVWIIQFSLRFVEGVAIPEAISAISALAWLIVLGIQMFKQASRSKE
jgi:hypothetical membrane protein